ncbi:hypothetical protein ROZALSC1DRAFT_20970 [Rozella allomycis CSF55]|uniref:IF140/IFT172/WDR19 TPR domain-containing protein n=1 Tax=Rozella allomycis (strain CSF55) TaxID=988480 RepID=A0A4P9YMJ7_ROZAC|nr:hypothetical protein ROZALSC1DRAFT_20970 [Rozella allomycis CSF55]
MPNQLASIAFKSQDSLIDLANLCIEQENYEAACKAFLQANDYVNAAKSLIKTGNLDKIIKFANVAGAKDKQVYMLTANYLQTLDWRSNESLPRAIISILTKAKSFTSLNNFYFQFASFEIHDYQNYERVTM